MTNLITCAPNYWCIKAFARNILNDNLQLLTLAKRKYLTTLCEYLPHRQLEWMISRSLQCFRLFLSNFIFQYKHITENLNFNWHWFMKLLKESLIVTNSTFQNILKTYKNELIWLRNNCDWNETPFIDARLCFVDVAVFFFSFFFCNTKIKFPKKIPNKSGNKHRVENRCQYRDIDRKDWVCEWHKQNRELPLHSC